MYQIEHLSFTSNMVASLQEWVQYPWHVGYAALRCMACQDWQSQHTCRVCMKAQRNQKRGKDPWSYMSGCLEHLRNGSACLGSLFNSQSPETTGESMIPTTANFAQEDVASEVHEGLLASHDYPVHGTWWSSAVAIVHQRHAEQVLALDTHHKKERNCASSKRGRSKSKMASEVP